MGLSEHYSHEITNLSRMFFEAHRRMRQLYPSLPIEGDVRLTIFSSCQNLLDGVNLGLGFHRHVLSDPKFFKPEVPHPDVRVLRIQFLSLMLMNLSNGFFMAMESSFRSVLRGLDPSACKKGTGKFFRVYQHLLSSLGLRERWAPFLEFYSEIRNTIHNGFVYYSEDGKDKPRTFEGKKYVFRHAKPVGFVDWDLVLLIGSRLRELLEEVMSHPIVMGVSKVPEIQAPV